MERRHRWRAAKKISLDKVPCIEIPEDLESAVKLAVGGTGIVVTLATPPIYSVCSSTMLIASANAQRTSLLA